MWQCIPWRHRQTGIILHFLIAVNGAGGMSKPALPPLRQPISGTVEAPAHRQVHNLNIYLVIASCV